LLDSAAAEDRADTSSCTSGTAQADRCSSDRRRVRRFRLAERRTGFDRRRTYPVTGTLRDNPAALLGVLIMTNGLSALDFVLTYAQLSLGTIEEGNPVLAMMFDAGPGRAWVFKSGMMIAVSVIIWHQRKHRAILGVAVAALVIYLLVIAYHVFGIFWLDTL
jgi:hypothetical protein